MKRILIVVIIFCGAQISFGQATIKTMCHKVFNCHSTPSINREKILETFIVSCEPDIFIICELETKADSNEILNSLV